MAIESLDALREQIRAFVAEREWSQFHTPKNLACALSVEAAEVLELFQWDPGDGQNISNASREKVSDEIADVLIYLVMLADSLNVEMLPAAEHKLAKNMQKYPPALARGSSKKYTEL
jgi:NTP pyrophosphatase (non-canonical NTP hydrolase)